MRKTSLLLCICWLALSVGAAADSTAGQFGISESTLTRKDATVDTVRMFPVKVSSVTCFRSWKERW